MTRKSLGFLVILALAAPAFAAGAAPDKPGDKRKDKLAIPDTPAGKCAAAYFKSYNSGEPAMRTFEKSFRAKSALAKRSIDDRMAQYNDMRDKFGELTPVRILQTDDGSLSMLVTADGPGETFRFEFQFEPDAPRGLLGIMIQGPVQTDEVIGDTTGLDAKSIKELVDAVADSINENYVYPEKGKALADAIRKKLAAGSYDKLTSPGALASRLTSDLRAVVDDKHLAVVGSGGAAPAGGAFDPHRASRDNYGFEKAERLPGNIGYVKLNMFHPGEDAETAAAAAMNFLGNCDALIFDLRENGGGSPEMIAFLSGYLFEKKVLLNKFYNRPEDKTTETWSREDVPGHKFSDDVPVYVLVSGRTFSGAEEFTYNLKNLKRATIVGATTGGGAHPVAGHNINDCMTAMVPFARAINPITNTNWEGTGVEPDIKVSPTDALTIAQREALKKLANGTKNPQQLAEIKAAQRKLDRMSVSPGNAG